MTSKPLEQVTLADLATKDDLKNLATKDDLHREIGAVRQEIGLVKQELRQEIGEVKQELSSAVNLLMGEHGKTNARLEEMAGHVARLVAKSEGMTE